MTHTTAIDTEALTAKVQDMYRAVARTPEREFHFETGRALAERLGYPLAELDRIPAEAIESFAGVGWFFDLADPREGDTVLDLGSGSGMDAFFAALRVGLAPLSTTFTEVWDGLAAVREELERAG